MQDIHRREQQELGRAAQLSFPVAEMQSCTCEVYWSPCVVLDAINGPEAFFM